MKYKCVKGFHVGEALVNLKIGDIVEYENDYLIFQDGKKFYAPIFKSAIKAKWLEETTESQIKIEKIERPEEIFLTLQINFETPVELEKTVIESSQFIWDTKQHWKLKISALENLTKEQLEEVSLLETGKIKDRVETRLKELAS